MPAPTGRKRWPVSLWTSPEARAEIEDAARSEGIPVSRLMVRLALTWARRDRPDEMIEEDER